MIAASDPDILIAKLSLGGIVVVLSWRLIGWVRDAPITPDPWDAETDKKLSEPEIEQACHRCSTPQKDDTWFCPHCGTALGSCNNMMPYVHIYSVGEVLRNGVNGEMRQTLFKIIGYLFVSLVYCLLFAPVYWFFLFKNIGQNKGEEAGNIPAGVK